MALNRYEIYAFLARIPKGKVVTYGMIAEHMGNKKLARSIGNILHQNPDGTKYPCYKVVNSKGKLSDHYVFGGIEKQRELLIRDGIEITDNKVDLEKYGWNN